MSPTPNATMGKSRDPSQWIHIDDFSPGCYDGSNISIEQPVLSAPLGAAERDQTFCCSVLPGGSLGPLPALISQRPFSDLGGLQGAATFALIAGVAITLQLDNGGYEVVVINEQDDGVNHYVIGASFYSSTNVVNLITGPTITSPTTPGFFGAPYPAFTRMNAMGSPGPPPPGPKLVFPTAVATDARGVDGHLWVYPSVAAPTTFAADDLITGTAAGSDNSSITGQVITYGNRVICIVGVNYQWPIGGGINTNENFNYTDPPESAAYGDQQTIMAVEIPWGYGAWGTMSVGELLLVKKYGGAVILNGDINVPSSIIRVPGVESTGDFVGRACSTPIGLIYCSQNRGAWIWNGSNTSQKISKNISDSFFDLETGLLESNNYGFFVEQWQKWVLFSGNAIYDTDSNSWWNLFPKHGVNVSGLPNGRDIWWYNLTEMGNQMTASPLQVNGNTDPWLSVFDNTVPSPVYQWQSLPIHVTPNADRLIDIRQIIIRASDPTNSGAATIKITTPNGTFAETSVSGSNPIGLDPTILRFNVGSGAQGLQDIILQIQAKNTAGHSAPIIHSIDVEYKVRASMAVAD